MLLYLVLLIHLSLCAAMVLIVLLQQGKGADMGASFGGGQSSSLFGASGAGNVLTRMTTFIAIAFMVTSVLLMKIYQGQEPILPTESAVTTSEESNVLEDSALSRVPVAAPEGAVAKEAAGADANAAAKSGEEAKGEQKAEGSAAVVAPVSAPAAAAVAAESASKPAAPDQKAAESVKEEKKAE